MGSALPVAELCGLMETTLGLLPAVERDRPDSLPPPDEFTDATWGAETQSHTDLPGRARPSIRDICFCVSIELRRPYQELRSAEAGADLAAAFESAQRKLCRGLRALLKAAHDASEFGGGEAVGEARDLEDAVSIRRLYAVFRRSLRRPASEDPADVLTAVRYAAGAIALLVSSTAYQEARISDRVVLRSLRERAVEWARHERSTKEGLRLLGDVWACADLLRGINRRQELRTHDDALVSKLLQTSDRGDVAAWWTDLERLDGFDDELDAVILRARVEGPSDTLRAIGVARMREIARASPLAAAGGAG
jgi:hypothetical protein